MVLYINKAFRPGRLRKPLEEFEIIRAHSRYENIVSRTQRERNSGNIIFWDVIFQFFFFFYQIFCIWCGAATVAVINYIFIGSLVSRTPKPCLGYPIKRSQQTIRPFVRSARRDRILFFTTFFRRNISFPPERTWSQRAVEVVITSFFQSIIYPTDRHLRSGILIKKKKKTFFKRFISASGPRLTPRLSEPQPLALSPLVLRTWPAPRTVDIQFYRTQ